MEPLLENAILNDDVNAVMKLLDADSSIVNAPGQGERPIHLAAANNRAKILELLLQYGADINARNYDEETALHRAAEDAVDSVKVLLDHKADLNPKDRWGFTPLTHAIWGQIIPEGEMIAKMLLDAGATFDITAAVAKGDLQRVREILAADPDAIRSVRAPDMLLGLAVSVGTYGTTSGRVQIIKLLFENGLAQDKEALIGLAKSCETSQLNEYVEVIREHVRNMK